MKIQENIQRVLHAVLIYATNYDIQNVDYNLDQRITVGVGGVTLSTPPSLCLFIYVILNTPE